MNGEWRITNAPEFTFRMLTQPDFVKVYRAQDLYFFDSTGQVLVPDAVFVPTGTSPNSLVGNLVNALLNNPQALWLQSQGNATPPAVTAFPLHTKVLGVTVDGTTATVNLGGPVASATPQVRQQMATQLVWTLTGQTANQPNIQNPPTIQAVLLEINGKPWSPSASACPGTGGPGQSPAQKLVMYRCKDPYPAATSSAFYYAASGQAWTRCASQSQVISGSVGVVQAVFGKTGAASLNPACPGSSVQASANPVPPSQTHQAAPLAMVAVSPDGKYLAGYSPPGNSLAVWAAGQAKPVSTTSMSGVTSIGWDRRDYLWVTEGNATTVIGQPRQQQPRHDHEQLPRKDPRSRHRPGWRPGGRHRADRIGPRGGARGHRQRHAALRPAVRPVRPDGHRADRATRPQRDQSRRADLVRRGRPARPRRYGGADLAVGGPGRRAARHQAPGVLPGAVSITANKAQNVLVAGLTGNRMEVSAGLTGPWQPLGSPGQNPAFQTPAFPVSAQS